MLDSTAPNMTLQLLVVLLLILLLQAQAMPVPYREASTYPPTPTPSKWGPYSGPGDFGANMVIILTVLFCAVFLALAINAIIRYLLCPDRRRGRPSSDPEKPSLDKAAAPSSKTASIQVFTAGAQLAGTEAPECAICLLEFADGDHVRVLSACNHGFHVECIERWLRTKSSCPTCRQAAADPRLS